MTLLSWHLHEHSSILTFIIFYTNSYKSLLTDLYTSLNIHSAIKKTILKYKSKHITSLPPWLPITTGPQVSATAHRLCINGPSLPLRPPAPPRSFIHYTPGTLPIPLLNMQISSPLVYLLLTFIHLEILFSQIFTWLTYHLSLTRHLLKVTGWALSLPNTLLPFKLLHRACVSMWMNEWINELHIIFCLLHSLISSKI